MDPFNRHIRRDLADKTPSVGEAELDAQIAAHLQVFHIFRLIEQLLDKAATGLQSLWGFE